MSDPLISDGVAWHWDLLYSDSWQFLATMFSFPIFILIFCFGLLRTLFIPSSDTQGFKKVILFYIFVVWIYSICSFAIHLDIALNPPSKQMARAAINYVRTACLVSRSVPYFFYLKRIHSAFGSAPFVSLPEGFISSLTPLILYSVLSLYYPLEVFANLLDLSPSSSSSGDTLFYIIQGYEVLLRLYLLHTMDQTTDSLSRCHDRSLSTPPHASLLKPLKLTEHAFLRLSSSQQDRTKRRIRRKTAALIKFSQKQVVVVTVSFLSGLVIFLVFSLFLRLITFASCLDASVSLLCLLLCLQPLRPGYDWLCGGLDRFVARRESSIYSKIVPSPLDSGHKRSQSSKSSKMSKMSKNSKNSKTRKVKSARDASDSAPDAEDDRYDSMRSHGRRSRSYPVLGLDVTEADAFAQVRLDLEPVNSSSTLLNVHSPDLAHNIKNLSESSKNGSKSDTNEVTSGRLSDASLTITYQTGSKPVMVSTPSNVIKSGANGLRPIKTINPDARVGLEPSTTPSNGMSGISALSGVDASVSDNATGGTAGTRQIGPNAIKNLRIQIGSVGIGNKHEVTSHLSPGAELVHVANPLGLISYDSNTGTRSRTHTNTHDGAELSHLSNMRDLSHMSHLTTTMGTAATSGTAANAGNAAASGASGVSAPSGASPASGDTANTADTQESQETAPATKGLLLELGGAAGTYGTSANETAADSDAEGKKNDRKIDLIDASEDVLYELQEPSGVESDDANGPAAPVLYDDRSNMSNTQQTSLYNIKQPSLTPMRASSLVGTPVAVTPVGATPGATPGAPPAELALGGAPLKQLSLCSVNSVNSVNSLDLFLSGSVGVTVSKAGMGEIGEIGASGDKSGVIASIDAVATGVTAVTPVTALAPSVTRGAAGAPLQPADGKLDQKTKFVDRVMSLKGKSPSPAVPKDETVMSDILAAGSNDSDGARASNTANGADDTTEASETDRGETGHNGSCGATVVLQDIASDGYSCDRDSSDDSGSGGKVKIKVLKLEQAESLTQPVETEIE